MNKRSSIFFLCTLLFFPQTVLATRKVFTTPLWHRVEQDWGTNNVSGDISRIWISLRNISAVPQTVTVKLNNISRSSYVQFIDAASTAALSSWTTGLPVVKKQDYTLADKTSTLVLNAGQSNSVTFRIVCPYVNTITLVCTEDENDVNINPYVANSNSALLDTRFSIDIEIEEDRGAVLGDLTINSIVVGQNKKPSTMIERSINGGRAF